MTSRVASKAVHDVRWSALRLKSASRVACDRSTGVQNEQVYGPVSTRERAGYDDHRDVYGDDGCLCSVCGSRGDDALYAAED